MKHKHADLIHEWADGAEIQRKRNHEDWDDAPYPNWDENTEYRIKPESKPDIVHIKKVVLSNIGVFGVAFDYGNVNIQLTFDGETGELKSAEVIK